MRRALVFLFVTTMVFAVLGPATAEPPAADPVRIVAAFDAFSPDGAALVAELEANNSLPDFTYEAYADVDELFDWVNGEDPPDLIISSQPAVVRALADNLVDLGEYVKPMSLRRDFGDYLIDAVSVDGAIYGAPVKLDLKTLVWYKPAEFEANGYSIPRSFNELVALSDSMVADGLVPWTNYIESGQATGWMGTDWIEDMLLSAEGPAVYDQWVDHSAIFTDLRVEAAFVRYQQMIDTPGYVFDRANMLNLPFAENASSLGAGEAMMHKQASFFAAFIETSGYDLGEFATFRFPSIDPAFDDSVVGGGDYLAAVTDSHDVRALVRFMTSPRFGREVIADSAGWVLPNVRFDTKRYTEELTRSWADEAHAAIAAGQFRFDASDLMPPQVGAGTFWSGIVDLVSGAKTIPQILSEIDATWPS